MAYPTYKTRNGSPVTAYVAEAIGKTFKVDGGDFTGKTGVIGSYVTAEEAIAAAKREKSDTCDVQVTDTRADGGPKVIFKQ